MPYQLIISTASSRKEAAKLARILISEKLAACVSIVDSIESHYRWKGKVLKSKEAMMLIKSHSRKFKAIQLKIQKHHSYTVPEIIAVPIAKGNPAYLKWVKSEIETVPGTKGPRVIPAQAGIHGSPGQAGG